MKNFKFSAEIHAQIETLGYQTPTPIQEKAIPHVLAGKDVLGLAQTGTGKTAAFVLPMLERFMTGPKNQVRGLIIAPTRELAEQINETIIKFSKKTRIHSMTIYGGVSMNGQIQKLRRGVDIIVACPGRLLDHINQGTVRLSGIEMLVLDEADQMFDMGFLPDIKQIISTIPPSRQTMLFSATMPADIRRLSEKILTHPVTVEANFAETIDRITHTNFPLKGQHLKTDFLIELLNQTATQSVLIFTRTKHRAKSLDKRLQKSGFKSASLQGNLSQNQRQAALNGFREGKYSVMVATDIAARGIDISKVSHVINYDMPDTPEAYTHRIGRTGRASRTGDAYNLITAEDRDILRQVERKLDTQIASRMLENFNYDAPRLETTEFPREARNRPRPQGGGQNRWRSSAPANAPANPRKRPYNGSR